MNGAYYFAEEEIKVLAFDMMFLLFCIAMYVDCVTYSLLQNKDERIGNPFSNDRQRHEEFRIISKLIRRLLFLCHPILYSTWFASSTASK